MIPPDVVAQVRERSDILVVIGETVPSLKRKGRTYVGLCPFHKEKTGSFNVNPDRGFFHCFGCRESGSVIDFIMKVEGATFPEAVRSLAERLGMQIEETRGQPTEVDRTKKLKDDLYAATQVAAVWFEQQLREHPLRGYALDELEKRGLAFGEGVMDEALRAFRIGYAPAGWDGLAAYLKAQGISPLAAETAGLLVPRSSGSGHYDRFRHRLMFAVCDPRQGRVVAFSGRALAEPNAEEIRTYSLPAPKPGSDPAPKYINSPESPIYTKGELLFGLHQAKQAIRTEERAIVVEGNFDVVSLHARGLGNVVAPLGTAFTVDQAKLLKRYATDVVFLFDADVAGTKAVRQSREPVREAGLTAKVATIPEGGAKDPDELARERGIEAVLDVVGQARGMLEWLIDRTLDNSFSAADVREKLERVELIRKLLAEEDDPLVRMLTKNYANELAARIDLKTIDGHSRRVAEDAFRVLEESVRRAVAKAGPPPPMKRGESSEPPRHARMAPRQPGALQRSEIVGVLIEFPVLLQDPEVQAVLSLLEGNSVRTVMALEACLVPTPGGILRLDTDRFLAQIPEQVKAFVAERLAAPQHDAEEAALRHLLDNGKKLQGLALNQEMRGLAEEQERAAGDWDREVENARAAETRLRASHGVKENGTPAHPTPSSTLKSISKDDDAASSS
jgi:DNA primase